MKKDYKMSKVKYQWEKSQRDARGGARYTQDNRTRNPHRKKTASKNTRKKKEAPRYAANTVGKQDSIPLDATAQLKDSSA